MTEIEELIVQAQAVLAKWKKPNPDEPKPKWTRSWNEILDNRSAPPGSSWDR